MNRFHSLRQAGLVLVAIGLLALRTAASAEERAYKCAAPPSSSPADGLRRRGTPPPGSLHRDRQCHVSREPTSKPGALYAAASDDDDQLFETISGELDPESGVITATVTFHGGTGRFAGATGSATLVGQLLPGGRIAVIVKGTIDF